MSIQSVFSKIVHGVVTVWDDAETEVNNLYSAIKSILPASAQAMLAADVAAAKQAASNGIGLLAASIGPDERALVAGIETALNAFLVAKTGGLAVPLVPIVDSGINAAGSLVSDTVTSWLLSAKASLAANPAPAATEHPADPVPAALG